MLQNFCRRRLASPVIKSKFFKQLALLPMLNGLRLNFQSFCRKSGFSGRFRRQTKHFHRFSRRSGLDSSLNLRFSSISHDSLYGYKNIIHFISSTLRDRMTRQACRGILPSIHTFPASNRLSSYLRHNSSFQLKSTGTFFYTQLGKCTVFYGQNQGDSIKRRQPRHEAAVYA